MSPARGRARCGSTGRVNAGADRDVVGHASAKELGLYLTSRFRHSCELDMRDGFEILSRRSRQRGRCHAIGSAPPVGNFLSLHFYLPVSHRQ
jgi:hypothetical protein